MVHAILLYHMCLCPVVNRAIVFRSAMVGDKEVGGDLPTIADDLVVTKYKMAAEIVNSKFLSGLVPCSVLDTLDSDVGVLIT